MQTKGIRTALSCLVLLGAATRLANAQAPETALDGEKLLLNLTYAGSEGVVRLNGIPVERFGPGPARDMRGNTRSIRLAQFGINGENTFTIDAKAAGPSGDASVEAVMIYAGTGYEEMQHALAHPVFRQKIVGTGTIRHTMTLRNVPQRIFDDATPWQGDPDAVLAAVRALRHALAKPDAQQIAASFRSLYDTTYGLKDFATFDEFVGRFIEALKTCKLSDLPAKLKVEGFYGGRLWRVVGPDDAAPIRILSSADSDKGELETVMELGDLWCYRDGAWLPLGK
jgi:hypothetical protein